MQVKCEVMDDGGEWLDEVRNLSGAELSPTKVTNLSGALSSSSEKMANRTAFQKSPTDAVSDQSPSFDGEVNGAHRDENDLL